VRVPIWASDAVREGVFWRAPSRVRARLLPLLAARFQVSLSSSITLLLAGIGCDDDYSGVGDGQSGDGGIGGGDGGGAGGSAGTSGAAGTSGGASDGGLPDASGSSDAAVGDGG
jgi:hypothetical protein